MTRRNSSNNTAVKLAIKLGCCAFAIAANAAHSAETEAVLLKTIKVKAQADRNEVNGYVAKSSSTASKTDTPLIETPQSISIVTADRIEAIGATTLTDAVRYTPGVAIHSDGFDTRGDWLIFRGFDAYEQGYFLDGLQLRNNNSFLTWQIEPYGAERIEVLRGPSSVLYGQNIPGGTVNAASKLPTEKSQGELLLQAGNYSRREIAGDVSGPIDADGEFLYRLTALKLDSDTQIDHVPYDRDYVAPALTWQPSADTSLTVLAHYLKIRTSNSRGSYPVSGTLLPNPNGDISTSTFLGEPDFNHFDQDQWTVGYLFEHRLSSTWTLRQNARYGKAEVDYREVYAGDDFIPQNADPADPANYRVIGREVFGADEDGKLFTIDNQAQAEFDAGSWQHTVLIGLDYQRGRYTQYLFYGDEVDPIDVYAPIYGGNVTIPDPYVDADLELDQTGLYVQDQIKFGERWVVTLGGRYDHFRNVLDDNLATEDSRRTQSEGDFTGRAGVVYLTPQGWAPYVSYSESFSPILSDVNPDTNERFDPESGRQYEAGLRYQPPAGNQTYSVAVYDLRRRNYVSYDPDNDYVPRAVGEIEVNGAEFEVLAEIMPRLNLTAAYTWTPKAEVTKSADESEVGKQFNAVPERQGSLWIGYQFQNGFKFGTGARYVGSTDGRFESAPKTVPSYTVYDALLGYDLESWSFALNARNLTNKEYLGRNCVDTVCNYGEQRQVIGTVRYLWQ